MISKAALAAAAAAPAAYTPPLAEILKNDLSKENGSFHHLMSVNPIGIDNVIFRNVNGRLPGNFYHYGGSVGAKRGHFSIKYRFFAQFVRK